MLTIKKAMPSLLGLLALALVISAVPVRAETIIIDDSGREIRFKAPFKRIISLYGAHTENLFSLGLDAEIIGVSTNESYPPAALTKPAFSYRDDPERLLAARPDLVLVRPMIMRGHPGLAASLERAGVTVVSLQPSSVWEMLAYWQKLGRLTGRENAARIMADKFRRGLARLKARVAGVPLERRPKVYFESIHRRMKTFAPTSMAVFALEAAGGINLAADADPVRSTNIAQYSKERILSHARDMDVYLSQKGPMNRVRVEDITGEPGFAALRAVREGRVYLIDEQLVSRPTLRLLKGIKRIQQLLYPRPAGGAPMEQGS